MRRRITRRTCLKSAAAGTAGYLVSDRAPAQEPEPAARRAVEEDLLKRAARNVQRHRQGEAAFRGFYGRYAIRVKPETGKAQEFAAVLRKQGENRWRFTEPR